MRAIRILGLSVLVMVCELGVAAQAPSFTQDLQNATISGVVLDVNDARIVGAIIKFENAEVRRRVKSDDEGSFRIELPPGEYRIYAEQPGFKKFVFSPFRAKAGVCELVNIHMEVQVPKSPVKVTKPGNSLNTPQNHQSPQKRPTCADLCQSIPGSSSEAARLGACSQYSSRIFRAMPMKKLKGSLK